MICDIQFHAISQSSVSNTKHSIQAEPSVIQTRPIHSKKPAPVQSSVYVHQRKKDKRVAKKDVCKTPQHQAGDAIVNVVIENVFLLNLADTFPSPCHKFFP